MNIFYLARDPKLAAAYHCDKHVVKMIVESAQLLSTACHLHDVKSDVLYRMTHKNHPSAIWTRQSRSHYVWLLEMMGWLCYEYTVRYGKSHKTSLRLLPLADFAPVIPEHGWLSEPPQCMPDDCKTNNTVMAYRNYYRKHKAHFATWKTKVPYWYEKE